MPLLNSYGLRKSSESPMISY